MTNADQDPELEGVAEEAFTKQHLYADSAEASRIYLLPNLMTAGNLFCGFVAMIRCVQAKFASTAEGLGSDYIETIARTPEQLYEQAIWFILAAVIFDILDGLMARLTRKESLFGKEFDSLADVVSFGLAPALLVFFQLLTPTNELPLVRTIGGLVGFFYLLCAAVRLARYNVLTSPLLPRAKGFSTTDFLGLPVPAAAGTVSSIILVMNRFEFDWLAFFLPPLLIVIALLMVSHVPYPSLRSIRSSSRVELRVFLLILVGLTGLYLFHFLAVALVFLGYIGFGLWRILPKRGRKSNQSGA